jgi:hypothetical protein
VLTAGAAVAFAVGLFDRLGQDASFLDLGRLQDGESRRWVAAKAPEVESKWEEFVGHLWELWDFFLQADVVLVYERGKSPICCYLFVEDCYLILEFVAYRRYPNSV